ncbi:DUF4236 domain-containing protein [Rhodothermus profundi]|uniref:DUF4236 domain-containing protein n=1 Tax=Rhodothermus profundi TaxID=633813 RepID=A0A1M6SMR3_9BACT|nr:DUF4236 domain-containing protein [Rhodothermus profundi]SHK46041.1 Protein of unknown function [Rhodothermus profundi]
MPFQLYKTFCLGPIRLTISHRGLGISIGARGLRIGRTPGGRPYIRLGRGRWRLERRSPRRRKNA